VLDHSQLQRNSACALRLALALTTGLAAGGGGVDGGSEEARCESAAAADRQCDAGLRDAQNHALLQTAAIQTKVESAKAPASLDDAEDTVEISNPNAAWSPANGTISKELNGEVAYLQLTGSRRRCCYNRRRSGKESSARRRNCQWDISAHHRRRETNCKGCTGRRRRGISVENDIKCDKCADALEASACPSKCVGYGSIAPVCREIKVLDAYSTVDDCTQEAGAGYMPLIEKSTATSPYSAEWNMCIKAGKILGVQEWWTASYGYLNVTHGIDHEPKGCFYSEALQAVIFNRHATGSNGKGHAHIICVQKDA